MKKVLASLVVLFFLSVAHAQDTLTQATQTQPMQTQSAQTQKLRLNVYGNYAFDDRVDNAYSYGSEGFFEAKIKGSFLWGAGLEYRLHETYGLELMYLRQDTHAPVSYWDYYSPVPGSKSTTLDLALNYILVGGVRSFKANSKVEPFGGLMLGMAIIDSHNPEDNISNSATKFAWGARLGTNIWASERVGIKLQAQFLSVTQGAGGGLYFGTGGAGAGISTYSSMLQFVLGGGLVFKLGR